MKKTGKLRITFNAPIILGFVGICFGVTLLGMLTNGGSTLLFFMNYRSSIENPLTYVRAFTHVFGHVDWSHFLGNTSYLLLLGPMLEEKYGSKALVVIMTITAFVTGVVNSVLFPDVALCGASGIVFSFIILASFTGFREREIPLTFILVLILYVGQQIYDGIILTDNISNIAHIVGGLVGAVVGYVLNKKV